MCWCSRLTLLYDAQAKLDITDKYIKNNKIYYFYTDACCCPKRHEFQNPDHYRLTKKSSIATAKRSSDLENGASSTGLAKPSVHAENGTVNVVVAIPAKRNLVIHQDEPVSTPSTLPPVSLFYRLFCCFGRRKLLRNAHVYGEVDIVCGYIYDPSGRMCLGVYDPDHDTFGIDIKPVNPDIICCGCLPESCLHPYRAEDDDW